MELPAERTTSTTKKGIEICQPDSQRQCMDGSCISRMELCPEEEMMNQDTVLIMIGVGMGVVLFLIMLYCLQQRHNTGTERQSLNYDETDHPELLMPPPAYDEAVNINLYPPTPQRNRRIPSAEEPITPPPNYDAALHILAQSQENVFASKEAAAEASPVLRRAVSVEHVGIARSRPMTFSSFGANSKSFGRTANERKT
ncbi:uncharacterized protein [Littorina saxatilis]|uniref:Uncharacterized protein n=1 Tax=Littorina saxatilis TaxID=31220 RepID=A0AAN9GPE8_9CAEN